MDSPPFIHLSGSPTRTSVDGLLQRWLQRKDKQMKRSDNQPTNAQIHRVGTHQADGTHPAFWNPQKRLTPRTKSRGTGYKPRLLNKMTPYQRPTTLSNSLPDPARPSMEEQTNSAIPKAFKKLHTQTEHHRSSDRSSVKNIVQNSVVPLCSPILSENFQLDSMLHERICFLK